MMSLRTFARSAPRTFSRIASQSAKPQLSALRNPIVNTLWKQAITARFTSAFSTSSWSRQANEELLAKLQSEIDIEQSMRSSDNYSNNIKEYIENSAYEVKDTPGQEEITLTRKYGDENITVTFTIADLANLDQDQEPDEYSDDALYDDQHINDVAGQQSGSKGLSSGSTRDGAQSNATANQEYDDEELDEELRETGFPARTSIKVERAGKGALLIEALAQDGEFTIDSVLYFPNAEQAEPKTAEKEWERRALYTGPQFGSLDEDLQLLLEKYLEERGINTRMALFIPDYIDFKEQKEYLRWLSNVKNFVE